MPRNRIARRRITKLSAFASSASSIDTCVLSVDVGTTALKAMLLAPDGTAIASTERAYATGTTSGESGLSGAIEQQPGEWLDAFIEASHDLLDPLGGVANPTKARQVLNPAQNRHHDQSNHQQGDGKQDDAATFTIGPGAQRHQAHQAEQKGTDKGTQHVLRGGVLHQQAALVKSVAENYKDFRLVVTGGDGAQLADWLDSGYYPNLIFDGMELLCAG